MPHLAEAKHRRRGFKPTAGRIPLPNSLFSAQPDTLGSAAQAPPLPSLAPVAGSQSAYDKDSVFAYGCRMARKMEEETAWIRRLRDEALESAGLAANPPHSAVFDRPEEGLGYRIVKVQKRAFDETKAFPRPGPRATRRQPFP